MNKTQEEIKAFKIQKALTDKDKEEIVEYISSTGLYEGLDKVLLRRNIERIVYNAKIRQKNFFKRNINKLFKLA